MVNSIIQIQTDQKEKKHLFLFMILIQWLLRFIISRKSVNLFLTEVLLRYKNSNEMGYCVAYYLEPVQYFYLSKFWVSVINFPCVSRRASIFAK